MKEHNGRTPQSHLTLAATATEAMAPVPPDSGPLMFARAPYGPLVETCAEYGVRRSRAHEYAQSGLIDTFTMGRKRYVWRASLDTLPERIAKVSKEVA